MSAQRERLSLQEIQYRYDEGIDRSPLENLIRAFRGIQAHAPNYNKSPQQDLSFFRIAGFHGEPFEGVGRYDPRWWGGYCHHKDVLFPTWHRAYLFHLENALRKISGCGNVTLPFWDECFDALNGKTGVPIPSVLTAPEFPLDERTDNPLYSYTLQRALAYDIEGNHQRYSKEKDYKTVRYPLSGLVGPEDKKNTEAHNKRFTVEECTTKLNKNVNAWLEGKVKIDKTHDPYPPPPHLYPDTTSVLGRYEACLNAPTYTLFSNNESMQKYREKHPEDKRVMNSLESPHNAIHLAVGGFYQKGEFNADPIRGANGDMGDNETAAFDPIFFFHHCFIDYVFWLWQKKHGCTVAGSLTIDPEDPGARSIDGSVGMAPGTPLDVNTALVPFKDFEGKNWLTLNTVTDIEAQLGYKYGVGSLDPWIEPGRVAFHNTVNFTGLIETETVDRTNYHGSFIIRILAKTPCKTAEIGREAVLSRWNLKGCKNCQNKLTERAYTLMSEELEKALLEGEEEGTKIKYEACVEYRVLDGARGFLGDLGKDEITARML